MILGLDISTSITGYTVIDENGSIVLNEAWNFTNKNKFESIFEKAAYVKKQIIELSEKHQIKKVYIEKSLQSFSTGFSSAKTLSTLASFNGVVSWICFEVFGHEPQYIAATSARKTCGIKIEKGVKAKEVVLKHLIDNEPSFVLCLTRTGSVKPESYDKADSIIIAKAGFLCEQNSKS